MLALSSPTMASPMTAWASLTERTLATHVLAPFRLSWLLAPLLLRAEQSVIMTVTSGGMYTQRFDPDHIEAGPRWVPRCGRLRAGQTGSGCAVPRVGPSLGQSWRGQLRRPSRLGGHARPGHRVAHLCQTGPAASDPGAGRGHGDMAGGRRTPSDHRRRRQSTAFGTTGTGVGSTTCRRPDGPRPKVCDDGSALWDWCARDGLDGSRGP